MKIVFHNQFNAFIIVVLLNWYQHAFALSFGYGSLYLIACVAVAILNDLENTTVYTYSEVFNEPRNMIYR